MLNKVKLALRIKSNSLDEELNDLINAGIQDLRMAGITFIDKDDPLIIQAIKLYCKSNFETDINKAIRYKQSFEHLKQSLSLSSDYKL